MRLDLFVRRARWAAWSGALPVDGVDQQPASRRVELRALCAQGKMHVLTTGHTQTQALLRHGHGRSSAGTGTGRRSVQLQWRLLEKETDALRTAHASLHMRTGHHSPAHTSK